jgi:hypothetical protein
MAGGGPRRQAKGFAVAAAFLAGIAAGWWWHAAGPLGGTEEAGPPGRIDAGRFVVPEPAGADGRRGYLMVQLSLEPKDRAEAAAVAGHLAHVKDAAVEAILALSPGWFDGAELRQARAESELRLLVNRNLGAPLVARAVLEVRRRLPAPAG